MQRVKVMDEAQLKKKISRFIFPLALILPGLLMIANPAYDELWSLIFFSPLPVRQILTDLALPNNHPLNTFFLKLLSSFSDNPLILRLPSLICGAFVPVFCGELAYRWSRKNRLGAMIAAAVLAAFSVPLAVYCGQARGYAMQLFFLLICILGMSMVKENPRKAALLSGIGGVGTFFCVPTGALFLLPAGIGFLIYSGKEERRNCRMWIAAGVIALLGGIFYGVNFSALQQARSWGSEINTIGDFFLFIGTTFASLILVPALPAAIPAFREPKRWWALALLMLPLVFSAFSNGGPARTYLYLPAALAVAGGIGIGEVSAKWQGKELWISGIAAFALAVPGVFLQQPQWQIVDYTMHFETHAKILPKEMLPVYRASAGFPMITAHPAMLKAYHNKLALKQFNKIAFFECAPGEFNGLDENQSEAVVQTACRGEEMEFNGLACVVYDLKKCDSVEAGKTYFLIYDPKLCKVDGINKHGKVLALNVWFTQGWKLMLFVCDEAVSLPPECRIYQMGDEK